MTYPLSAEVVEGQATEAAQYNNLRSDALFLGGDPTASGTVRDLLASCTFSYELQQEGTNTIKLPASASAPVGLMINGGIYSVTSVLSLYISAATLPDAGRYPLYATISGAGFVLSLSSSGDISLQIGSFCWDGLGIIPGTLRTNAGAALNAALKRQNPSGGRLSLAADNPLPDQDITLATALHFVPYRGNVIGLYLYGAWEFFEFSALTLQSSLMSREIPYDIFITADSSGLRLVAESWLSVGARGSALLWLDGVRVSGSDPSRRYLGTAVLNSSGYFEDTKTARMVSNENNQVKRPLLAPLVTSKTQGAVHANVWSPYYDEDAPVIRMLVSNADTDFKMSGVGISTPISESDRSYLRAAAIGIGKDMATESPYTGNVSCVPVFTHTFGNGPMQVDLYNSDSGFLGLHTYTLAFWTNYSFFPKGTEVPASGEAPGLFGYILA